MKKVIIVLTVLVIGTTFLATHTWGKIDKWTRVGLDGTEITVYRYYDHSGEFVKEDTKFMLFT